MTNDLSIEECLIEELIFYDVLFELPLILCRHDWESSAYLQSRKYDVMAAELAKPVSRFLDNSFQAKIDFTDEANRLVDLKASIDEMLELYKPWLGITGYQLKPIRRPIENAQPPNSRFCIKQKRKKNSP